MDLKRKEEFENVGTFIVLRRKTGPEELLAYVDCLWKITYWKYLPLIVPDFRRFSKPSTQLSISMVNSKIFSISFSVRYSASRLVNRINFLIFSLTFWFYLPSEGQFQSSSLCSQRKYCWSHACNDLHNNGWTVQYIFYRILR